MSTAKIIGRAAWRDRQRSRVVDQQGVSLIIAVVEQCGGTAQPQNCSVYMVKKPPAAMTQHHLRRWQHAPVRGHRRTRPHEVCTTTCAMVLDP
jgi:hypothetical protein